MANILVITNCRALHFYWYEDLIGHTFTIIDECATDYYVMYDGLRKGIRKWDATIIIENDILNVNIASKIHIKIQHGYRWRALVKKMAIGEYPYPVTDGDFRKAYRFAIKGQQKCLKHIS